MEISHRVPTGLPEKFCFVKDIDPSIIVELRYATEDNFLGRPAIGYDANVAILTIDAALALKAAQAKFMEMGYSIKIFDAYRPHVAVEDFWAWANDVDDIKMKEKYYPKYDDKTLLFDGFIARYSKHSRGSAVDLTIVENATGKEVDMGGPFDFFGPVSHTHHEYISEDAKANRALLLDVMRDNHFVNYHREWWHFELENEPYPLKPDHHFSAHVCDY